MLAAYAEKLGLPDPFDGLIVGERPDPSPPAGWEVAEVRTATVNPHDLWTLKGVVGFPFEPPVILGCDGAGVTSEGAEVVFYPVLGLSEGFRMLTDGVDGTFASKIALPKASLVAKPKNLSLEECAGLGTAWLTAYRMLFTKANVKPGERVLIQGATGGVSTAAIMLAAAAGAHVTATSRKEAGLEQARSIGAHDAVLSGGKLSKRVDVVIETVGEATWSHSLKALNPDGRLVVAGATTGGAPSADIQRLFIRQLTIMGSAMGSLSEFKNLISFVEQRDIHPPISERVFQGVEEVPDALRALDAGEHFGKIVIRIS